MTARTGEPGHEGRRPVHLGAPVLVTLIATVATAVVARTESLDWYLILLLSVLSAVFIGGCSFAFAYDLARSAEDNPSDS